MTFHFECGSVSVSNLDYWSTYLHLHFERPRPSTDTFWASLKLLNFDFSAEPDPSLSCGSGSATLDCLHTKKILAFFRWISSTGRQRTGRIWAPRTGSSGGKGEHCPAVFFMFCLHHALLQKEWGLCSSVSDPYSFDTDPGIGFDDKNWKKLQLFLGLHKGRSSYRRSLQPSKENIQHFKTIFVGNFCPGFWIQIPDPDTDSLSWHRWQICHRYQQHQRYRR